MLANQKPCIIYYCLANSTDRLSTAVETTKDKIQQNKAEKLNAVSQVCGNRFPGITNLYFGLLFRCVRNCDQKLNPASKLTLMGTVTSTHRSKINYEWKVEKCNVMCNSNPEQPKSRNKEFVIFSPGFFEGKEHESHEYRA